MFLRVLPHNFFDVSVNGEIVVGDVASLLKLARMKVYVLCPCCAPAVPLDTNRVCPYCAPGLKKCAPAVP